MGVSPKATELLVVELGVGPSGSLGRQWMFVILGAVILFPGQMGLFHLVWLLHKG